jgi:hypothetical protein
MHAGRVESATISRTTLLLLRGFLLTAFLIGQVRAQAPQETAEFRSLATQIAQRRLSGADEPEDSQQRALAILDRMICAHLSAGADLKALNDRLSEVVSQEPSLGESYSVIELHPGRVYALLANFSLSGPAAVRIYAAQHAAGEGSAAAPPAYQTVARIDRFTVRDFFDESLHLVPLSGTAPAEGQKSSSADVVFVTISGRTDDLQTGAFAAWRFLGDRLEPLWTSDLLSRSSYETANGELRITYCADPDEERPRVCGRMVRDRFAWEGGAWQRLEQSDVPLTKPPR